jgi:hypothetical protein
MFSRDGAGAAAADSAAAGFFAAFFGVANNFDALGDLVFGGLVFGDLAFGDLAFATVFLPAFFAGGLLVALFADFFAALFAGFFAACLALFAARFFVVALPAARFAAFPVFFFFEDFLATAKILVGSNGMVGMDNCNAYRVASASSENTEKTSGFRSRL